VGQFRGRGGLVTNPPQVANLPHKYSASGRFRRLTLCILVLAALAPGQQGAAVPRALRGRLAALVPDGKAFGGQPRGETAYYSTDLYKYIDGGAEAYNKSGFVALVHREYKTASAEITVDIYDMGGAANALAMFRAERSPDCRAVAIGAGGYAAEGLLNFTAGRYYVKLLAFSETGGTGAALETAARGISGRIGPAPE
jgi:hypothetical protein